jgi:hypothetical protein
MANIYGIHSHNFSSGTEELIAVWKNSPMIRSSSAWNKMAGAWLTDSQEVFMESFLDKVFGVNGTDANWEYGGTSYSTSAASIIDSPIAKYIKRHKTRLYLFNIAISNSTYKSRCWYSDLPNDTTITWGLEYGSDLVQTADSKTVTSAGSLFETRNIKIGDPLIITSGANTGKYTVGAVNSETSIELTTAPASTVTGSFWIGGNWFDVETDDGDVGMGMTVVSNELILYKKNSAHRYNASGQELRQIKSMPGTTSPRSLVVGTDGYSYSYHPTGIYRTLGTTGQSISDPIKDIVENVATAFQDNVVAWEEDKNYIVFHLGDVTTRDGETISNCEAKFDESANSWTLQSRDRQITCATNWLESNVQNVYGGSTADDVYQLNHGNSFTSGSTVNPIHFGLELKEIFPEGSEAIVDFNRLRAYVDNGPDIQIMYKLIYKPTSREDFWISNTMWKPLKGSQRGGRNEWYFPLGSRASGVKLKVIESSTKESFLLEKMVLYYSNVSNR